MPSFTTKRILLPLLLIWSVLLVCSFGFGIDSKEKGGNVDERILGKWKTTQILAGKPLIHYREFLKNGELKIYTDTRPVDLSKKQFYRLENAKLYILNEEEWKSGQKNADYELILKLNDRDLWVERMYQQRGRWIKRPMVRYEKEKTLTGNKKEVTQ